MDGSNTISTSLFGIGYVIMAMVTILALKKILNVVENG